jgi:transcriptional regulator with XRE-family HTH domain
MSQDLWAIRRRKKMKVRDLAAKSGVPVSMIHQYEAGEQSITQAHLRQLARALIVDTWEIKPLSDPKPRARRARAAGDVSSEEPGFQEAASQPIPTHEKHPPTETKQARPPAPARSGQIEHLLQLAELFPDTDQASLEALAGKPLTDLTQREASNLLNQIQERIREERSPDIDRPFDRHRAYLPEGVDGFELEYLTEAQEAGDVLDITLFNGQRIAGKIVGFGPYSITLRQADGEEATVNKLAIAYYLKKGPDR